MAAKDQTLIRVEPRIRVILLVPGTGKVGQVWWAPACGETPKTTEV